MFIGNLLKYYSTILHIKNPHRHQRTAERLRRGKNCQPFRFSGIDSTVHQADFFCQHAHEFEKDTRSLVIIQITINKGKTEKSDFFFVFFFYRVALFSLLMCRTHDWNEMKNHRLSFFWTLETKKKINKHL